METDAIPGRLIICSPYDEPQSHNEFDASLGTFIEKTGRREAGYVTLKSDEELSKGSFTPLPLVNQIREKVKQWRESGYPHTTRITKELLRHWHDHDSARSNRLFFCQREAAETLIWLQEALPQSQEKLEIPRSGGDFQRLCAKMATGTGKTVVMAMVIAWQVINKVTYENNPNYSKNILIIAPGLTVRKRLAVLDLSAETSEENYYRTFDLVPPHLLSKLIQGVVHIINRHRLEWETQAKLGQKRSVVKLPEIGDGAYVAKVLGQQRKHRTNWVVINDEAHHAWFTESSQTKGINKKEIEESTKWVQGLDRIHRVNRILHCYDFTATPFAPVNAKRVQTELFPWTVSDFGLFDAIESGLVKTPVASTDKKFGSSGSMADSLGHIYRDVSEDLNKKENKSTSLPAQVVNAYQLLSVQYQETYDTWMGGYAPDDTKIPPVMISVVNTTETAERVAAMFRSDDIACAPLSDPDRMLHIDSNVLNRAESVDIELSSTEVSKGSNKSQRQEALRTKVDTVGKAGKSGEQLTNIVSVMMLSEGWDARNVTQIMGLRAFTSQLLCEQVVGRGLRRRSYDLQPGSELFIPEYVTVFGVPFELLPREGGDEPPQPPPLTKEVKVLSGRAHLEISWPNVTRIEETGFPMLTMNADKIPELRLDARNLHLTVDLGVTIEGKIDTHKISSIDLRDAVNSYRLQRSVFRIAREIYAARKPNWVGHPSLVISQLVALIYQFIESRKLVFETMLDLHDLVVRKLLVMHFIEHVAEHIWGSISSHKIDGFSVETEPTMPLLSTVNMPTWYTSKDVYETTKSHINRCVNDSNWEAQVAASLDKHPGVKSWFKNTQKTGFRIAYRYEGESHVYIPDFIVKLTNDDHVVIEVKGVKTSQDDAKYRALERWCEAVSSTSQDYGKWHAEMVLNPDHLAYAVDTYFVQHK